MQIREKGFPVQTRAFDVRSDAWARRVEGGWTGDCVSPGRERNTRRSPRSRPVRAGILLQRNAPGTGTGSMSGKMTRLAGPLFGFDSEEGSGILARRERLLSAKPSTVDGTEDHLLFSIRLPSRNVGWRGFSIPLPGSERRNFPPEGTGGWLQESWNRSSPIRNPLIFRISSALLSKRP